MNYQKAGFLPDTIAPVILRIKNKLCMMLDSNLPDFSQFKINYLKTEVVLHGTNLST
jgi:hypothetical protein